MPKQPTDRALTVAERRALAFERVALVAVLAVAAVAAAVSFFSLWWAGQQVGMARAYAWLYPLAVDGFAVACSVGIVASQARGQGWQQRLSEWVGLGIALAVSVAGNVAHARAVGTGALPVAVVTLFAAAPPIIVAYGVHVYVRATARGVSARVMADAPDRLVLDDALLTGRAAPTRPEARPTPAPERAPQPVVARPTRPALADAPGAYEWWRAQVTSGVAPTQAEIAARLGCSPQNASKVRRTWQQRREAERDVLHAADPGRLDPVVQIA